jgi:hypothetical protein
MVAPEVEQLRVTLCDEEYVPAEGLNVGAATVPGSTLMMYVADAMSLSVMPLLNALALIVVVELTWIGLEYSVDEDVGVEPSAVYLMVAPEVEQLIDTLCAEEYVPAEGLNVGAATTSGVS